MFMYDLSQLYFLRKKERIYVTTVDIIKKRRLLFRFKFNTFSDRYLLDLNL